MECVKHSNDIQITQQTGYSLKWENMMWLNYKYKFAAKNGWGKCYIWLYIVEKPHRYLISEFFVAFSNQNDFFFKLITIYNINPVCVFYVCMW